MPERPAAQALRASRRGMVPLYHRVYLLLLQGISDHSFPPDRPMPGELELAATLGVSRITLRAALKRLEEEGLVQRQQGRGTFPSPGRLASLGAMPGLRNQVSLALRTGVEVLEHRMVPAGPVVAAALEVPAGTEVLRIVRVRGDAQSPVSYSVCHVPAGLAALLPRRKIRSLPMSTVLASSGLVLDRTRERISACLAEPGVAACLGVEVGAPLLAMVRVVAAADGRVVEHLRVLYRVDRYEYALDYGGAGADGPAWRVRVADRAD